MDKHLLNALIIGTALFLTACSDTPKPAEPKAAEVKEPVKPPEPVAAQSAFFEMYKPARQWATDVQPLSLAQVRHEAIDFGDFEAVENGNCRRYNAGF